LNNPRTYVANLMSDLKHQSLDATMGHAQAAVTPTDAQLTQIVAFEAALNSAQAVDATAGRLDSDGASGAPRLLSQTAFFPGINDSIGGDPTGAAFRPNAFTLYSNWKKSPDPNKRSVARGEDIFNTHPLLITNVRGLNDATRQPVITGTFTTCHDAPNVGNHSLPLPLEIGTSRSAQFETDPQIQAALSQLSMPDLPVFQIVCNEGPDAGEITYTSDPANATLSGLCTDVGNPSVILFLNVLFAFGWLLLFVCTFLIDHFDLFGLKRVWRNWREPWIWIPSRAMRRLPWEWPVGGSTPLSTTKRPCVRLARLSSWIREGSLPICCLGTLNLNTSASMMPWRILARRLLPTLPHPIRGINLE
jgi:hypothetical protein